MFFKRPREQTLQGADPYRFAKNPHKPVGRGFAPAATVPHYPSLPQWGRTDEGLQAVGTAMRNVLLTSVPHQSPTAPASPTGKPRDEPTPTENAENPHLIVGATIGRPHLHPRQAGGRWPPLRKSGRCLHTLRFPPAQKKPPAGGFFALVILQCRYRLC